jgi:hypothetical protein
VLSAPGPCAAVKWRNQPANDVWPWDHFGVFAEIQSIEIEQLVHQPYQ